MDHPVNYNHQLWAEYKKPPHTRSGEWTVVRELFRGAKGIGQTVLNTFALLSCGLCLRLGIKWLKQQWERGHLFRFVKTEAAVVKAVKKTHRPVWIHTSGKHPPYRTDKEKLDWRYELLSTVGKTEFPVWL